MGLLLPRRPLHAQPDRRLAALAAAGQDRAFDVLAARHRQALARYCRRLGLSEDGCEDAVQQGLTRAWLALARGAQVREPRAWLYRIVHNTAVTTLRGAAGPAGSRVDPLAVEALRVESRPAAGSLETAMRARDALSAVAELPGQQRAAMVLTAIEGRSHEEAADMMGVSRQAVRGLLYRARRSLREAAALGPLGLLGRLSRGLEWLARGEGPLGMCGTGAAAGGAGTLCKGLLLCGLAGLAIATAPGPNHGVERGRPPAVKRARTRTRGSLAPRLLAAAPAPARAQAPSAAARFPVAGQAVVGDRLPRRGGVHELPVLRPDAGVGVERAQADGHLLVLQRRAAEQGRPADSAEHLGQPARGRREGAHLLMAAEQPEAGSWHAGVRGGGRAGAPLAVRAMAVARGGEGRRDLEPHGPAQAAALQGPLAGGRGGKAHGL